MRLLWALALAVSCGAALGAQAPGSSEPVVVDTEHPRLFLRPARLRLLKRERDRASDRWQQLETLLAGNIPMPEAGFAEALSYRVSGQEEEGRRAIAWALGPTADLRQMALVFDWCQDLMTDAEKSSLAAAMAKGMAALGSDESVPAMRSRALAAVALYDYAPDAQGELDRVARWWNGKIAPALVGGRDAIPRDDAYALFELLYAIRDNAELDLRESCPRYFRSLPIARLASYYPAVFAAPENDFRVAAEPRIAEPDMRLAALSRAADLAMTDYDPSLDENQMMQGWLMRDPFAMRGAFGAPYEFLWANPYQAGLNYYLAPLTYHNPGHGRLFVRSSWQDSAAWLGWFDGVAQKFDGGRVTVLDPHAAAVIDLGSAVVCFGPGQRKFRATLAEEEKAFVAALEPLRIYQVEIDDEEMYEEAADPGGILELDLPHGKEVGVRVREAPAR
ncbi:MAG: hypothetical protein ABSC23_03500 [Bryobacteraceae bacterium]|jgi:hypothetical protein